MSRDDSHLSLPQTHGRRMRAEPGTPVTPVGYDAGNGEQRPIPGDDKFPFVLTPPDLGEVGLYVDAMPPFAVPDGLEEPYTQPVLDRFAFGLPIDVRAFRQLMIAVTFKLDFVEGPGGGEALNNVLALLPQVAMNGITTKFNDLTDANTAGEEPAVYVGPDTPQAYSPNQLLWHSLGVVDPVLRGAFPTATVPGSTFVTPTYAYRNVHMSLFYLPYARRQVPPLTGTLYHTTLVFDVSPYELFRIGYARAFVDQEPEGFVPTLTSFGNAKEGLRLYIQGQR